MMQRRHQRRRRYAAPSQSKQKIRRAVLLALGLVLVFIAGQKTLNFFGVGNSVQAMATVLGVRENGVINVSVEGGPLKRAEDNVKLYPGDTIVSSPRNYATLTFFDESSIRIDESTQILITESKKGESSSTLGIEMEEGTLWMATPSLSVFSGSITRTIATPFLRVTVPSESEFVLSQRSLTVFSADGQGLSVLVAGNENAIIVGEGQQFTLPIGGEQSTDLYEHRSPLNPQQLQSAFVEESRAAYVNNQSETSTTTPSGTETPQSTATLTITAPEDGMTTDSAAIEVRGQVGSTVDKVRINGYLANVNTEAGTFSQELALPDEDEVNISIEAVNKDGEIIAEALRTVQRNRKPPEAPTITSPAAAGQTYRTNQVEFEISGTAPEDVIGIIVNDYRLQLFQPGDRDWSYLASTKLNNLRAGTNTYEVIAINRGGYRSDPATLTIVLGEGEEGIVSEESEGGTSSAAPVSTTTVEESELPANAPLMPGSISIFAPTPGTSHTATQTEFLIEGNIPTDTASVWVNGYRLRLYEAGKDFFNYIASVELNTLKRGRNVYRITIRNAENQILDEIEYVVTFQP